MERAFEAKQPIDYRRINVSAKYIPLSSDVDQPYVSGEFHVLRVQDKTTGWRIFRPAAQNGRIVFTAGQWVSDDLKTAQRIKPEGEHYITGYVRSFEKPSRFAAKSSPDLNRWMSFNAAPNVMNWASLVAGKDAQTGYYIDAIHSAVDLYTGELPPRVPEIPNNHFDYMLTWYSFALILLVIYLLLHIRGNRLTLRRP